MRSNFAHGGKWIQAHRRLRRDAQRVPRILLINYRYFVSGGPERYMFDVKGLLEANGHDVVPFSVAYSQNEPSRYSSYFAAPLAGDDEIYFRDHSCSARTYARSLERAFYSPSVHRSLTRLIHDTQPDIAFVHHYLRKLSPAVLRALADRRIPSVVFLHDYLMVCPNAHLLRDNSPCELCVQGSLRHSVRHRCVQGSFAASVVNYAATRFHQFAGFFELGQRFVAPSLFVRDKMLEGGWPAERVTHIPLFVSDVPGRPKGKQENRPTIVYAGRLDRTKGVETLLAAVRLLERDPDVPPFEVQIAGTGDADYVAGLRSQVAALKRVTFSGWKSREELLVLLRTARCSVVPSIWYENCPLAVLESMAVGTPVVGSAHGALPEQIEHGVNGLLVPPRDAGSLARELRRLIVHEELARVLGSRARAFIRAERSPERHYERLMGVFQEVCNASRVADRAPMAS